MWHPMSHPGVFYPEQTQMRIYPSNIWMLLCEVMVQPSFEDKERCPLSCDSFVTPWTVASEKAMAPHSSTLAWKIPWMKEPGRLKSIESWRVGHDWAASLSCIGEGNGNPLQCSCLENPRDGGAWWAAVSGVSQSQTRLKRLSSSSRLVIVFLPRSKHLLISCL